MSLHPNQVVASVAAAVRRWLPTEAAFEYAATVVSLRELEPGEDATEQARGVVATRRRCPSAYEKCGGAIWARVGDRDAEAIAVSAAIEAVRIEDLQKETA